MQLLAQLRDLMPRVSDVVVHPSRGGPWERLVAALVPALAVACTSVDETPSSVRTTALEFEGSWIALDFPCDVGPRDLPLSLKRIRSDLSARVASDNECAPFDALAWQGTLPLASVTRDDLPLTFRCDLRLPSPRIASVTLLSVDRMVLVLGDAAITLQRGTLRTRAGTNDAGTRAGDDTSKSAEAPAGTGGSSGKRSGPEGGASGAPNDGSAGAADGGGAGVSGMSSSPTAGTGGAASPRDAGQDDAAAGRAADASTTGGAGTGTAAGGAGGAGTGGSEPAAGSGGSKPVGPPDITGRLWDCINLLGFCSCIAHPESEGGGRACSPKLPCCYTDLDDEDPNCICEAAQAGGGCYVFGDDANRPRVDWCPGQSDK